MKRNLSESKRVRRNRRQIVTGAALVATALLAGSQVRAGATYTENFDIKPVDWTSQNNTGQGGSTYGFSNTNNTGGVSGAGEAGGTFARSSDRGYYADTRLYGTLTENDFIHGEGEFFFGNGATADTDHAIGHQNFNSLGGNANILGIGVFEGSTPANGFRFTYQIYNDAGADSHGNRTDFANGQYRYSYDWNPVNQEITVKLFNSAGTEVYSESSGSLAGIHFSVNMYGFASGLNGSGNASANYNVFIDATKYTTYMPKITQRFDSSPANWQVLGGATYGFSNTNNTGQESGAGEAGGVMVRDLTRKGYGDTHIQFLTQAQPFGASGEFSWGLPNDADNEVFIAHYAKDQVDGIKEGDSTDPAQGGHNMAGLYILDETPTSFRMIARVYDSNAVRYSSDNPVSVPAGTYKFDYAWDPSSLTLTARLLTTDGSSVVATNSVTLPGDAQLNLDTFGITTGFNGSLVPGKNYSLFIDNVTYVVGHQWTLNANGNWGDPANWDGPVPNGNDHVAYFGGDTTAPRTITVDSPKTVGNIFFDNLNSYTVAGSTITMDGAGQAARITVLSGGHTISAPVVLNSDLLVNSAGSGVALTGELTAGGKAITKIGAGTVQFENVRAASLDVQAGSAKISLKGTANSAAGTSQVATLSIASGASVDLTNNSMIIDYSGGVGSLVDDVRQHLLNGRLTTSTASPSGTKLGYADNAALSTPLSSFGGISIDTDSLLIKYTYAGDANLDGQVDITDLAALATAWQTNGVWVNGDFDYSGFVDITDLAALATNWQKGVGAPLAQSFEQAMASVGLGGVAVPEPAALGLVAAAAIVLNHRRRA